MRRQRRASRSRRPHRARSSRRPAARPRSPPARGEPVTSAPMNKAARSEPVDSRGMQVMDRRTAWVGPSGRRKLQRLGRTTCLLYEWRQNRHPSAGHRPLSSTRSASIPLCEFHACYWCSMFVIGSSWLVAGPSAQRPRFDVIIANGRIVDGTGAPWFRGDIGITGDRITAVGALGDATAGTQGRRDQPGRRARIHRPARPVGVQRAGRRPRRQQDSAGRDHRGDRRGIVDRAGQRSPDRRTRRPTRRHFGVAQDWRTLADYFKRLEERSHTTINVATFVGAGGLRSYVIGKDDRPATPAELEQMKQLVAAGDAAGRARPQHLAAVRARPLRLDRRDRRAGEGRGALRRRLLHASALGERADLRVARRSVRDRRARAAFRRRSGT